jgi:uncharacterized protein YbjT (DUF2867 family)
MVTGASGVIGRAAIPALLARNPEVRAAIRRPEDADGLRALGAKVTVGRLDDAPSLAEVLQGVHTVVHLVGGVNQASDDEVMAANHRSTLIALGAARSTGVRRFVLLSYPGASIDAPHPFLRAKGIAEEAVAHSGLEHAILRCTHVFGAGGLWFTSFVEAARNGFVVGHGTQAVAPVFSEDVARAIAALDDAEEPVGGTWSLEGPDPAPAERLAAQLLGSTSFEHVAPADAQLRLEQLLGIPVSRATCELFAADSRGDTEDASTAFGLARTTFAEGISRVAASLGLEG